MNTEDRVVLQLSKTEVLVLFDWLSRMDDAEALPTEDPAEQHVLWRIEGQLESALSEPFAANYDELVAAARKEVRRFAAERRPSSRRREPAPPRALRRRSLVRARGVPSFGCARGAAMNPTLPGLPRWPRMGEGLFAIAAAMRLRNPP